MALIYIEKNWCANGQRYWAQFNDVTGMMDSYGVLDDGEAPPDYVGCTVGIPSLPPPGGYDPSLIVYSDGNWDVYFRSDGAVPYFAAFVSSSCSVVIDSVSTTPAMNGNPGTADVVAHADMGVVLEYTSDALYGGAVYQDSPHFDLPAGSYYFGAREKTHPLCQSDRILGTIDLISDLTANIYGSNVSAYGGHDGIISVIVNNGSGNYTLTPTWTAPVILLGANPQTWSVFDLYPAIYSVLVTDNVTGQTIPLSVTITQPAYVPPDEPDEPDPPIPEPEGNFIFFPMMNSLRFVEEQEVDGCSVFQTMDNKLFCHQTFPYFMDTCYHQKVAKCDALTIQFQSNYLDSAHSIKLKDYKTGGVIKSYSAVTKESNINQPEVFDVVIREDTDPVKARVMFNTGTIPIPVSVGDGFQIFDNADDMNGNFVVTAIQNDALMGTQYLVISLDYSIAGPSSNAKARFLTSVVDFNILEFLMNDLGSVANGVYYVEVIATGAVTKTIISEPIYLLPEHVGTNMIEYRSFDNCFDMTWTTGILCRIRIESSLFKRFPAGSRTTTRNSDGSLHKLAATPLRVFLFEFFSLPPYMLEKLSVIFDCDLVKVNTVEYQTDDGISEPRYITRYKLANSDIRIEQVGWFKKNNSDDLGNVDLDTGYILANGGFLKR